MDEERKIEETISELYEKTGRPQLALDHYRKARILKDSVYSEERNKELTRKEMNYEFDKKVSLARAEQDKKDALQKAEAKKQRLVLMLISSLLLLVLLFAIFIFRALRLTRKQKQLIESQKKAVDEKNLLIEEQKKIVEEKQKDILDSIHYAKRIQESLLPSDRFISKTLNRLNRN